MSYTAEGMVEIDLEELWTFVLKRLPTDGGEEYVLGVPRVNKGNGTLEIDFAVAVNGNPHDWSVKPKAIIQWEQHKDQIQE